MTTSTSPDIKANAIAADLKGAAQQLKADGRGLVSDVREHAESYAEAQKEHVADRVGGIADALRSTSGNLRDQQETTVAGLTDSAADQLEKVSRVLRQKDLGAMLSDASDLARSHPAIFLGGAVALGFLAGRFLRASGEHDDGDARATSGA